MKKILIAGFYDLFIVLMRYRNILLILQRLSILNCRIWSKIKALNAKLLWCGVSLQIVKQYYSKASTAAALTACLTTIKQETAMYNTKRKCVRSKPKSKEQIF